MTHKYPHNIPLRSTRSHTTWKAAMIFRLEGAQEVVAPEAFDKWISRHVSVICEGFEREHPRDEWKVIFDVLRPFIVDSDTRKRVHREIAAWGTC